MKKLVQVILLIILFPCLASAQISTTTCPGAGCIDFNVGGNGSVGIQITGTWSGTITFQASVNNTTFTAINVIPATSPTAVSTTTGNGLWSASIGGLSTVRAVFTSYVSGSANVAFRTAQAKAGSGGTGGGGSVTSIATTSPVTGGTITTTGTIACPTCGVTGTGLNQFASTTSAQLAGVLSDKTGTGLVVFQTSPTIITPTIADFTSSTHGHVDAASGGGLSGTYCALAGCTMVGNIVMPNNGNIQSTSGNMNFGSPAALFVQGTTTNTFGSGTGLTLLNTNACGGGSCVTGNINILTGNATGGTATAGSITMDAGTTTLTKGTITIGGNASKVTVQEMVTAGTVTAVANVGANSCGTSAATIAGNDNAFTITVGATAGTQCRVTFAVAAGTRRECAANDESTTIAVRSTYVDTTHTDFFGAFTAGDLVSAVCFAR